MHTPSLCFRVWDYRFFMHSGECMKNLLEGHSDEVTSVALSADGRTCISGSNDRTVRCVRVGEHFDAAWTAQLFSSDGLAPLSASLRFSSEALFAFISCWFQYMALSCECILGLMA